VIYHTCPECGANLDPGEQCDCVQSTTWWVELVMPDSDTVGTRINGTAEEVFQYYGGWAKITKMERLAG